MVSFGILKLGIFKVDIFILKLGILKLGTVKEKSDTFIRLYMYYGYFFCI